MAVVPQRSQAWLDVATPAEIDGARRRGELAELMGGRPPIVAPAAGDDESLTEADLAAMEPREIVEALKAGQLDHLLRASAPNA